MEKRRIFILAGTGLLAFTTIGVALGSKYLRGVTSKATISENKPRNIRLAEVTSTSATISWTTDEPDYGFVSYGETMNLGKTVQTESRSTIHSTTLSHLSPGKTYYYKIGVGEKIYDNEGIPYSFTTPKGESQKEASTSEADPEEALKKAIGTDNPEYDLNGDGIVNAIDLMILRKKGQ